MVCRGFHTATTAAVGEHPIIAGVQQPDCMRLPVRLGHVVEVAVPDDIGGPVEQPAPPDPLVVGPQVGLLRVRHVRVQGEAGSSTTCGPSRT
jgi:hypothetical protein